MEFICNSCGSLFEKPKRMVEKHGFDTPPFEVWLLCPYCLDNDFEEIQEEDEDSFE